MAGEPKRPALRDTWSHFTDEERRILHTVLKRSPVPRGRETPSEEPLTFGQRLADRVTNSIGSWPFIIVQSAILLVWIIMNTIAWRQHWDPFPFILLNLVLSFQAAYAAPIIMMSQNRQSEKDHLQVKNDYEVNLKAELEIMQLHEKFNELRDSSWVDLAHMQQRQIEMLERLVAEGGGQDE